MKKPDYLDVFGQITQVDHIHKLAEKEGSDGEYSSEDKTIKIDQDLNGSDYLDTLLHEALHAYFDRMGISEIVGDKLEEMMCYTIPKLILENFDITPI